MTSDKQYEANRANAQFSTGPKSEAGKAASSRNATTHGLTASADSVVALSEEDIQDLDNIRNRFRPQCQPQGELEEEAFQALCWSLFQAERARAYEAWAQANWEEKLGDKEAFQMLNRMSIYRMRHERGAEKNRLDLGRLQKDRWASNEANKVLQSAGFKDKTIAATLPTFEIRKRDFKRCSGWRVAGQEILGFPNQPPLDPSKQ
jgi:hypothetical protein